MSDTGTLAYWEWSAPDGSDIDDIEAVRAANPAFGTRINEDFLSVERAALDEAEYARERLGIFPETDDAPQWGVFTEPQWSAIAAKHYGPKWLTAPVSIGIEMPPLRTLVSMGAAGACADGGTGLHLAAQIAPEQVVAEVVDLTAGEGAAAHVVIDPESPAGSLIPALEAAGVKLTLCKYADLKKATGDLYDDVSSASGRVWHHDQPVLTDAVSTAARRTASDTWLIDRRTGTDASPLIAVLLARWGHLQPVSGEPVADFIVL